MANAGYIMFRSAKSTAKQPPPKTAREWLQRRLDARPETAGMQRMQTKTREEKARGAIDALTRDHMISANNEGKTVSEDAIRSEMVKVAEHAEAKKDR